MNQIPVVVVGIGMLLIGRVSAEEAGGQTRVRSENRTIVRLIAQGTNESATFRRLIETVNGSDGLVYVHDARCNRGVHACLMHTVDLAGPYRLLHVKVDLRRPHFETIADLAHELQHVTEALRDPRVINNARIVAFFRQLAPTDGQSVETPAALSVGFDVFDELISHAKLDAGPGGYMPVGDAEARIRR